MTSTLFSDDIGLARIRNIVAGREEGIPRGEAMIRLREARFPHAHRDFEALLASESEPPLIRALAARHLGLLNTEEAARILTGRLHTREESVLVAIARALGRIGGAAALQALDNLDFKPSKRAAARIAFAAGLIAHRLGAAGHDLRLPTRPRYLAPHRDAMLPINVKTAPRAQVQRCLADLAADPFGIEFAEEGALRLHFQQTRWMLLLNRSFAAADALERCVAAKGFLGVIAEWDAVSARYFTTLLILSTPNRDGSGAQLHLHEPDGGLIHHGEAPCLANQGRFSLGTVARVGTPPLQLAGRLEAGRVQLDEARVAFQVGEREVAAPLPPEPS